MVWNMRKLTAIAAFLVIGAASAAVAQQSILDNPIRTDAERARDADTKPLEIYAFWGIEPGMTVVDLMPGGGYNTVVLSGLVGDSGMVYAGPDRRGALGERLASAGLDNVHVIGGPTDVPAGSADAMITVRNVHDLGDRAPGFLAECLAGLKSGGVLGVVDARTTMEGFDSNTHRINQQMVIDVVTAAGFEFVESSELLANPNDDVSESGRGNRAAIDRMLLKFRKQ